MLPVSDETLYLLIPNTFDYKELSSSILGTVMFSNLARSKIVKIKQIETDIRANFIELERKGFVKFFECYWVSKDLSPEIHRDCINDFFSYLADDYECKISATNNINCYDYLLKTALFNKVSAHTNVLDFGCGTGLCTQIHLTRKIDSIIGYDFSERMREISRSKGLETINSKEFYSLNKEQFDVVLLNYVLHLKIGKDSLSYLFSLLVNGGVLIGNIHKNLHLKVINNWLDLNVDGIASYTFQESDYGAILIIKK